MVRAIYALLVSAALCPCVLAQQAPPASPVDARTNRDASSLGDQKAEVIEEADRVTVFGKPLQSEVYEFYRKLRSNEFCPRGLHTQRGYSCAEITYDVLDANGSSVGKCNVPIFQIHEKGASYSAVTYEKLDCSKAPKNAALAMVALEELFDPTTKDGTSFRMIGVIGIDQAREICRASADACVVKLFDRTRELSYCSIERLWPTEPDRRQLPLRPRSTACASR